MKKVHPIWKGDVSWDAKLFIEEPIKFSEKKQLHMWNTVLISSSDIVLLSSQHIIYLT